MKFPIKHLMSNILFPLEPNKKSFLTYGNFSISLKTSTTIENASKPISDPQYCSLFSTCQLNDYYSSKNNV